MNTPFPSDPKKKKIGIQQVLHNQIIILIILIDFISIQEYNIQQKRPF